MAGFLLFAALMAGVGAMVPSAKDAGGLSAAFIIGAILPFYTFSIISTDPGSIITQLMTYFPVTAPSTILIRNVFNNMSAIEAVTALATLMIYAGLAIMLAGKLFELGALEFTNRLSLKMLRRR
jgi:ABC-2 type transport system permease protein